MTTWEELLNAGELEGYDEMMHNDIDFECATETPCEECGGACRYEGRRSSRTGSYRAFSICTLCGRVIEF